mmetsp:Transcript_43460/g.70515  ORF Transcript_43460/g.70515 Transcript_43460/m.70515 type:complete len:399 (+) Transcript_43460:191-1387(+)|eukprot:CAMPEP_0184664780 /NCGR_PEP_ID=MMETSP0308-20130426/54354_1 /TAXON_ID=38269 /ORGANISM="Gloeochaete witrockiana, Strain SAG 46.84" /LENGTH=398 /DNA_ID=CAMNT_0027108381 /DNA_START=133 /DNA_END=1329 /DNA_ORIENTATION=-
MQSASARNTETYHNAGPAADPADPLNGTLAVYIHVSHAEIITLIDDLEAPRLNSVDFEDDSSFNSLDNLSVNDSRKGNDSFLEREDGNSTPECFVSFSVGQSKETTTCGMISGKEIIFNEIVTIDRKPTDPSNMFISMIDSSNEAVIGTCVFDLNELGCSEGGEMDQWFLLRTPNRMKPSATSAITSARFSAKGLQPSELKQNLAYLKRSYADACAIIRLHVWLVGGEAKPDAIDTVDRPSLLAIGRQRSEGRRPSDVGWHGMGDLIDEVVDDSHDEDEEEERAVVVNDDGESDDGGEDSDTGSSEDNEDEEAPHAPKIHHTPAPISAVPSQPEKRSIFCIADDLNASHGNILSTMYPFAVGTSDGAACSTVPAPAPLPVLRGSVPSSATLLRNSSAA